MSEEGAGKQGVGLSAILEQQVCNSTHVVVAEEGNQVVGVSRRGRVLVVLSQNVVEVAGIAVATRILNCVSLKTEVENRRQSAVSHEGREHILAAVKHFTESKNIRFLFFSCGQNLWPPLAQECVVNVLCGVNSETIHTVFIHPV